jgi:aminoglycoside 3-N-acetyltransferase
MANDSLYQKLVSTSPHIEMMARRAYYALQPKVSQKKASTPLDATQQYSFQKVIAHLERAGLRQGDILVIHSSFSSLKKFKLSPVQLIEQFLEYLGEDGTLAMPGIPVYPNELQEEQPSDEEMESTRYTYTPSSTRIWTGALPKVMIKDARSVRSLHPLNSMVAIGKKAEEMMKDNLEEKYPCGENSSWNFCRKHKAFVLGLGTDLTHSLTMIHVAEDTKAENWTVKNWYRDRTFIIKQDQTEREVTVKERRPIWGKLHFGERNLCKDLLNSGVMQSSVVEDTLIETMRADQLINFLDSKNHTGYPYFWV